MSKKAKNKATEIIKTKPIFKKGDKVILVNDADTILTIAGSKHTGFGWLYSFDEIETQCDRYAITKVSTK